jgi:hypothetical protein
MVFVQMGDYKLCDTAALIIHNIAIAIIVHAPHPFDG